MNSSATFPEVLIAMLAFVSLNAAKLPDTFKRCHVSDGEFNSCLKEAIQNAIKQAVKGIPTLGVFPIDPLEVTAINIEQGSGPVNVNLDFNNLKITGLGDIELESVEFDTKKYKSDSKVKILSPVNLQGDYKIDGKVMVLPISGEGKCNLTLVDVEATIQIRGEKSEKEGEIFMKVNDFYFTFDTSRVYIDFQNLFNGDKLLGDNMNTVLNENWEEITKELKPAIQDAFGATFKEISNRIFQKVPYNQIFLE